MLAATNTNYNIGLTPFDQIIISHLKGFSPFKRVYPSDMVESVPLKRSVRQMRRDMSRLAAGGHIKRVGTRKGYTSYHTQYLQ